MRERKIERGLNTGFAACFVPFFFKENGLTKRRNNKDRRWFWGLWWWFLIPLGILLPCSVGLKDASLDWPQLMKDWSFLGKL